MDVAEVSPLEAATALDAGGDVVYLDVRTVEEFVRGHVPRSLNIPMYVLPVKTADGQDRGYGSLLESAGSPRG